jgi:hypothetical protein
MKKSLIKSLVIAFSLLTLGCTSDSDFEKGKKILEDQGYTEVENTGHNYFCCDEKEAYSTGFRCKDKKGNIVEGCFCSSLGKGVTIRYE